MQHKKTLLESLVLDHQPLSAKTFNSLEASTLLERLCSAKSTLN